MIKILSAMSSRRAKFVLASSLAALLYVCGHSEVYANSAGQLQLDSAEYSVAEGDGFVTLSVSRMYGASGTVSVPYYITGGTATEGVDFKAASGELTFGDGETFKTIEIPIIDDHEIENTEGYGSISPFTITINGIRILGIDVHN
ncbi:Calx-beta domain-containing protein [Paenibacillus sp. GCM10027628]|uniref:Calx-beta domain-containing protein n=1 Tax=Paenibacillus sp. GCM10027628 TaxID=3273413 RepID=UPI003638559F